MTKSDAGLSNNLTENKNSIRGIGARQLSAQESDSLRSSDRLNNHDLNNKMNAE